MKFDPTIFMYHGKAFTRQVFFAVTSKHYNTGTWDTATGNTGTKNKD